MNELTPVMKKFILHWGEMGSTWGINRTVAQIYALLYLAPTPLTAEEISESLALARSTVSTGLHELMGWNVVHVVHLLGDRRDHFEAMDDLWEMFRAILRERKRREIDPTLALLREGVANIDQGDTSQPYVEKQLREMLDFFEAIETVYEQVDQMPTDRLKNISRLGNNFAKIMSRVAQG